MTDDTQQFLTERRQRLANTSDGDPAEGAAREFFDQTTAADYSYNFDWLGLPIIQYPQDLVAMQEIIWRVKPDLIVETGVARGGSLIFYASMLSLLGNGGRVVGVDIEIRAHNRAAIAGHPLAGAITLVEGSSTADEVIKSIGQFTRSATSTMVVLDSNHTREHVARELDLYSPFVTKGSYLVVFDTVIEFMKPEAVVHRPWGKGNSPFNAVRDFLATTDRFVIDRTIDKKLLISVAPNGYLECVKDPDRSL